MDDDAPSGLILDADLPLTRLAGFLRMAEGQVYRRMLELVEQVQLAPLTPRPYGRDERPA